MNVEPQREVKSIGYYWTHPEEAGREDEQSLSPTQDTVELGKRPWLQATTEPPPSRDAAAKDNLHITILHTNDLHGHLLPFRDKTLSPDTPVGGVAYLADAVTRLRQTDPEHTLLLDAGDSTQGFLISDRFQGKPVVESMNLLGYDAMALGNHDFDQGKSVLENRISAMNFPLVGANIVDLEYGTLSFGIKPYIIKNVGGVKVGILGLTTTESEQMLKAEDQGRLSFLDPHQTASEYVPLMKKEGAELIVVLSHLGLGEDRKLAAQVPGIDVIIGAHSHTRIEKPEKVGRTAIVQAGCYGKELGKLNISLDQKTHRVVSISHTLLPIKEGEVRPDPEVEKIIEKYRQKLTVEMTEVIAEAEDDITQRDYHTYREESALGNLICDLLRENTEADVAFLNASTFRSNLYKGTITRGDICALVPWEDHAAMVELRGKDLIEALEEGLSGPCQGIAVSGLKVKFDMSRPVGERIVSVETEDGAPVDPERIYSIATREFLADGCGGMDAMKRATRRFNMEIFRDMIVDSIRKKSVLRPMKDARLVNLSEGQS